MIVAQPTFRFSYCKGLPCWTLLNIWGGGSATRSTGHVRRVRPAGHAGGLGAIVGLSTVRDALINELNDLAMAIMNLNI